MVVSEQLDDGPSAEDIVDEELKEHQDKKKKAMPKAQMQTLLRPSHQLTTQHTQISKHTKRNRESNH